MKRICLAAAFCLLCTVQFSMSQTRIAVAILDGASGGPYHNWRLTTQVMKKELEETNLFDVTVLTAPAADGDFSHFHPDFSRFRAIVMNYDALDWPQPLRAEFERYVSGGGGL